MLNTVNWNNFSGPSGSSAVSLDVNGLPIASGASVTWSSNNTWSSTGLGEENNTATGENGDLMSGYLDSLGVGEQGPLVTVSGLSSVPAFSLGYDVYVYVQGGVNGRGGNYTLGGNTLFHAPTAAFSGVFVEDTTVDSAAGPEGTFGSNYFVFRNVTGDTFALAGIPTFGNPGRAGINGVEIVRAIPEPSALGLVLGTGLLGTLRRRRR